MFPVFPSKTSDEMDQLVYGVLTSSAALGQGFHPLILEEVSRLMTKINSYYTNAMEGNPSKLTDIEAALNNRISKNPEARNFQLEHLAHIHVQNEMLNRLRREPNLRICSKEFLSWLHERFYLTLPTEMRFAKTESGDRIPVVPGAFRDQGATVGSHNAPEKKVEVLHWLDKFEEALDPEELVGTRKMIGMASSHHRLLWIHPFSDGNGRVARLFTIAYGVKIGLGSPPLWTVTRAFARRRQEYDAQLAQADQPRRNDWDGRGPLSEETLASFCLFFLECCKDQIAYMAGLLRPEDMEHRLKRYGEILVKEKQISKGGQNVFESLFPLGKIARSKVPDLCHVKQRRATQIIRELLDSGCVRSETSYGDLKLNVSTDMAAFLFPKLT